MVLNTATITDSIDIGIPYTKDFDLHISAVNPATNTAYFTADGGPSWGQS